MSLSLLRFKFSPVCKSMMSAGKLPIPFFLALFAYILAPSYCAAIPENFLTAFSAARETLIGKNENNTAKKRTAVARISGSPWPGVIDHVLQMPYPDPSSPISNVEISINYPSIGNPEIDRDIRDWVGGIANAFESHLNQESAFASPGDGNLLEDGHELTRFELFGNYTVSRPSRNAVSVTFELWNYMGTNHGNLDIMTLNYNTMSGKRLDIVDIFEEPELALKIMSEYTRKILETRLGAARHTYMLLSGTEPLAENFASLTLTPKGICINFQPYQVAPGTAGIQKVEMALEELSEAGPMLTLWDKS